MEDLDFSWKHDLKTVLGEFKEQIQVKPNQLIVIGCSTSEVIGHRIGSSGSLQVAEHIFNELQNFSMETGVQLAFQCCEHLNRAIVIEREVMERHNFDEVTVIPVTKAGGSMATYSYRHFNDPVVVEFVKADYGIDIGDTLIGMHLKHVAVPIRVSMNSIGHAHVTLAKSRPKLIGGERAVYEIDPECK